MAFPNPAINPPTLGSSRRGLHSRSPSRSPIRQARDFDPLLRDLSPTTTLRAFTNEPIPVPGSRDSVLSNRISTASSSERALGVRAAQVCLDVRAWTRELQGWEWPGTFDVPEPARKRMRMSTMSILSARTTATGIPEEDEEEYCGSMPIHTVQAYEKRVDEIVQELDAMDVEELKEYALSAHKQSGASIDDSIGSLGSMTDLRHLDDYTALITATILQTLPYLSRLNRLLDIWSIRLSILRQTPAYLDDLKQARTDLDHGWAAIAVSPASGQTYSSAPFTRETMHEMKAMIEQQVNSLGRRLDHFLDELEGRSETVPEAWIEDFETLESAYGTWVVQAERKVLEDEWRATREQEAKRRLAAAPPEFERKVSDSYASEDPSRDEDAVTAPSSRPSSGIFDLSGSQHALRLSQLSMPFEVAREDSETLPESEDNVQQAESLDEAVVSPGLKHGSPTKHSRHVPIILNYDGDGQVYPAEGVTGELQQATENDEPSTLADPAPADTETGPKPNVKKRAAFLNGDIERTATLQTQAKSPVRPWEHASNAFTRLFKKDRTPEQSRSNSQRSATSQKSTSSKRSSRSSSKGEAAADAIVWGGRSSLSPLSPVNSANRKSNVEASARDRPPMRERSSSAKSSRDAVYMDGQRTRRRDYPDMPGGFRPRSRSQGSGTARSLTPKAEYRGEERRLTRMTVPETYKPKRLSSPFRPPSAKEMEAEYPADWPLASPPETEASSPVKETPSAASAVVDDEQHDSGPEVTYDRAPIGSDAFDRMFVQSFPTTPEPEFEGNPLATVNSRARSGSKKDTRMEVPVVSPDMLGALLQGTTSSDRGERPSSPLDMDGDDITKDDDTVGSFFPQQPSPEPTSDALNSATAKQRPKSSAPTSSMLLRLQIPGPQAEGGAESADDEGDGGKPALIKRASLASINSRPRSELRTIELPRRSSQSSSFSAPQTPRDSAPVSAIEPGSSSRRTPASPLGYKGMVGFPAVPASRNSMPTSPVSPIEAEASPFRPRLAALPLTAVGRDDVTDSPLSATSDDSPAPLNSAMAKMKQRKANQASPLSKKQTQPLKPGEDSFDRHVSEVLERLPSTAIKFKTRAGASTPVQRTAERRDYQGPRPRGGRLASKSGTPDITLAPAESSPKKSTSDNEVKLYHLTQAGRDEPIKLFVRLVGDGDRVMVRVGGGWADLADYLRQYAEHHGSRTASGAGIEIQTAEGNGNGSRKVSSSANEQKTKSTPTTPASAVPRPGSRAADARFSMGDSTPEDIDSPVRSWNHENTPPSSAAVQRATPKSTSTKGGSRPSTADSAGRPGSRQGPWTDGGLAGPGGAGKRADLPEQKARWVEGMIEKAKAASAEKGKEERAKYFGELGKAGGTRRVIFRQSSGVAGGEGENGKP